MDVYNIYRECTNDDECDCHDCESNRLEEIQIQANDVAGMTCAYLCSHFTKHCLKDPKRDSALQGHSWVWEIWHGNDRRFFENMRMRKPMLRILIQKLFTLGNLTPYTGRVPIEESLAIFLLIIGQGLSYPIVEERLQRSSETISNHFHMILDAVCKFGAYMITPTDRQFEVDPPELTNNGNAWPYFKGCIGAIDGTHIKIHVAEHEKVSWMNRKYECTTNVLAICDFSMCIIHATVGMEGSMHDARVLKTSMERPKFRIPFPPPGKYYLADAGYPLMPGFLTPYSRTRYHLPEFRANRNMQNRNEAFNYRHSSLRSVIERTFGILKKRWRILYHMSMVDLKTQFKIIWACICLHNFIRRYDSSDLIELGEIPDRDEDLSSRLRSTSDAEWAAIHRGDVAMMEHLRDRIRDSIPL